MVCPRLGICLYRPLLGGRSFLTGTVFGMTSSRTRLGEVMYKATHLVSEMRRIALTAKGRKGKFRKGPTGGDQDHGQTQGKKKGNNMGKVKCWNCQKMGHYAATCPEKKKKGKTRDVAASTDVDIFSRRFDEDFALMAGRPSDESCLVTWYIDSGASCHMTGVREQFLELSQRAMSHDIVLGDDRSFSVVGIGRVTFQRESSPPLKLNNVFYVPGLKKNRVSVSCIEDKGYNVLFDDGRVLLYPKDGSTLDSRLIGVRHERMYRMVFEATGALACMTSDRDLCELWHRRMGHLHHGALRMAKEITIGIPDFSL